MTSMISRWFIFLRALGAEEWFSVSFAIWLLLTILTPEDVYRTFFHALIYPLTLFLLFRRNVGRVGRQDPFVRLFFAFCIYAAVTTWFVGGGPEDRDLQASRWAAEAALGMLAFFFWALSTMRSPQAWGLWFVALAMIGSITGLMMIDPDLFLETRVRGLGLMSHPIQGASIAAMFLAVGLFLMTSWSQSLRGAALVLILVAVSIVWCFSALTLSRGPLVALTLYLVVLGIAICLRRKGMRAIFGLIAVFGFFVALIHLLVGLPQLVDQLISRGASYRLEIWLAYLSYPPESILFGNGLGFDFRQTDAANALLSGSGLDIAHPHNLWLAAFSETGLIGVTFQAGLLILPVVAGFRSKLPLHDKMHLQAILGLFVLLTFSDEFTLLISVQAIWLFGWLPLILVWVWGRQNQQIIAGQNNRGSKNP